MLHVLIIEPDQIQLRSLKAIINDRSMDPYDVILEERMDLAMNLFSEKKIDILISEIFSPIMSGTELFDYVDMVSPSTVKIAMTSASDIKKTVNALYEMHPFRLILKPVNVLEDILRPIQDAGAFIEKTAKEAGFDDEAERSLRSQIEDQKKKRADGRTSVETQLLSHIGILTFTMNKIYKCENDLADNELLTFYQNVSALQQKYMMTTQDKRAVTFTELMEKYHDPQTKRSLRIKYEIDAAIPDMIYERMLLCIVTYMETLFTLFVSYHCEVICEKRKSDVILMLKLDLQKEDMLKGVPAYKIEQNEVKDAIQKSSTMILEILADKIQIKDHQDFYQAVLLFE